MSEYTKRDIQELDRFGGHYSRHVNAMTGEGLHEKSDIAAELAWRDLRIDELERKMLAGLHALGIGCKSIDQCVSFEREVAGTVNVLAEYRDEAQRKALRLERALRQARNLIVGDIEVTARDITNGVASGSNIHDDCERIKALIDKALGSGDE